MTHKEIKVRKYRKDKRKPKKTRITITEDIHPYQQVTTFVSEYKIEKSVIPKERNPNLFWIYKGENLKIGIYLDSIRCFVWGKNGEFLGSLHKYDLKRLFSKIGEVLRKYGKHFN